MAESPEAAEQELSPLFTAIPIECRRVIYLQYWLDYGLDQHIYLFGPNSYLSHYPCILEPDAFDHHSPPPAESEPDQTDSGSESESGSESGSESESEPEPGVEPQAEIDAEVEDGGDSDQPEPHDDPGDIDGAIQDLTAGPSLAQVSLPPAASSTTHPWNASPWCMHERCFFAYMEPYDRSFERAYSRNYRRDATRAAAHGRAGLTKPFLVCKRMHKEASESLYSIMRFDFPAPAALKRFVECVPAELSARIRFVRLACLWPTVHQMFSPDGEQSPDFTRASNPPRFYQNLPQWFPMLRELTLTVHPNRAWGEFTKIYFEPLYDLAGALKDLNRLDVKMVTRSDDQALTASTLAYGGTPRLLVDAPFSIKIVPKGWHADGDCGQYWTS